MIKNEDTYCTVQHKIVRELGAWEAVVYGTITNLLRKTGGYGNVSNDTLIELIGRDKKSIYRWIDSLIKAGYLEKVGGKGRGNISIYYITKKGGNMTPFNNEEKRGQIDTEKGANMTKKGGHMPPINKGINKEINKENSLSSFDGSKAAKEEEDKDFIKKGEKIKLFRDEEDVSPETKASFMEWWNLFKPSEDQKCKFKVALAEWSDMPEAWRRACIRMVEKNKPQEPNPYFFLQHFSPTRFFYKNEHEMYEAYKMHIQLCRVRYQDKQPICSAWIAEIFELEVLDEHFEKRFER